MPIPFAAIACDLETGKEVILNSGDLPFAVRTSCAIPGVFMPLEDEDGPIGQLLVGPRSDFNRYNAAQLDGLKALVEPLAESLRAALKRAQQAEGLQLKLGTVEERLARLEGRGPRLSPT